MEKAVSAPFCKGVNFSSWLEWGNIEKIREDMFTKTDFENVKSLGCDVVRIPIHFENYCLKENNYTVPEKLWTILDRIAAWGEELKIFVIIDFHNATNVDSFTSPEIEPVLSAVWTQLAEHFMDGTEYLVFELMNEPHGIEIEIWNKIIDRLFKLVRGIDKKHYIIVGGADWNSFSAMKTLPDFKDDRIIYTFHFYDPHTFTHQGATWCHMERVIGIPFPYDKSKMPEIPADANDYERQKFEEYSKQGSVEQVLKFFDQYVEFSKERNAPVYCGEFGCFCMFAKPEERVNWYRIVADGLNERNIARTSWDYFGPFGIFDFEKIKGISREELQGFKWKFPEDLNKEVVKAMGLKIQ